jgi:hypothetical protein
METLVALASAGLVAPIIAVVDKAIFSNASGKEKMGASLYNSCRTAVTEPIKFLTSRSVKWIWLVYGGTYVVANTISAAGERRDGHWDFAKFVGSSTANVSLSLAKDRAFSRMYGVVEPKPVPVPSLALFAARDSSTILASFTLPPLASAHLQERFGMQRFNADVTAQLAVPLIMQVRLWSCSLPTRLPVICKLQIASTPLHLLGMDLYNRPVRSTHVFAATSRPTTWPLRRT